MTLARPELIERRPDWGAGRRNFTSLYLEPLAPDAMRALLAGLVPGLPESAARAIVGRADGIPLYAVETVRMLLAEGRLATAGDGTYAPVGDLSSLAIPETLTKRDRKVRHLAAARFFETLGTDELAGALAGHYLVARENAPDGPEADALAAQARVALRAAADRAAVLGAHEQALTFYEQALTVTIEPAGRAELLERAGESASVVGRHEAAERHLRASLVLRRDLGDRPAIANARTALGRALSYGTRAAEAIELLEPAATEFADLAANPAVNALGSQLARAYFLCNDNERAIEVADHVLEAAEHADLGAIIADTLVTKGTALAYQGRSVEGLGALRAGQELAEALDVGRHWHARISTAPASWSRETRDVRSKPPAMDWLSPAGSDG